MKDSRLAVLHVCCGSLTHNCMLLVADQQLKPLTHNCMLYVVGRRHTTVN